MARKWTNGDSARLMTTKFNEVVGELNLLNKSFKELTDEMNTTYTQINSRIEDIDAKIEDIYVKLTQLTEKVDSLLSEE